MKNFPVNHLSLLCIVQLQRYARITLIAHDIVVKCAILYLQEIKYCLQRVYMHKNALQNTFMEMHSI